MEEFLLVLPGNADSRIRHRDPEKEGLPLFPQDLGGKEDVPLVGEFHRIAQKIVQNLKKPHGISPKVFGNPGIQMHLDEEIFFLRQSVEHGGGI